MADEDDFTEDEEMGGDTDDDDDDDDDDDVDDDDGDIAGQGASEYMSEATARRHTIRQIMDDDTLEKEEKRRRIQAIMMPLRTQVAPAFESAACVDSDRNCCIVAPCCNRVFCCKLCHDQQNPPGHPTVNESLVREVVCKICNTRQVVG